MDSQDEEEHTKSGNSISNAATRAAANHNGKKTKAASPSMTGALGSNGGAAANNISPAQGDGAYSAIFNDRQNRFSIKHLYGDGEADCRPLIGTFYDPKDSRTNLAVVKSYFAKKQNVSFSFNPTSLTCNNCVNNPGHAIAGSNGSSVFILADQCFPAALPAAGPGECIPIIRIENGTVNELARLLVDVFAGVEIRVGSLILLASVSHLAAAGTAAYAESTVRAVKYLLSSFADKVTVRPGVPILLGGAGDSSLVRSLVEVAAWADSLPAKERGPAEARKAFNLCLSNRGIGKVAQAEKIILQLPISLTSFEKKSYVSGPRLQIFEKVKNFDLEDEKIIIEALVAELNLKHGTDLATDLALDRGINTDPLDISADSTVILVGNSNASYLATALAAHGHKTVVIDMRPWRPNAMTVNETKVELDAKLASTRNVVAIIFWCLDTAAFYSITDDSILPAVRDISGNYHIHGALITAPHVHQINKILRPSFQCLNYCKEDPTLSSPPILEL
jgi:hypothetical protein